MIYDCRPLANKIKDDIRQLVESTGIRPFLSVVSVGDDPASDIYMRNKKKACEAIGAGFRHTKLNNGVSLFSIQSNIEYEQSQCGATGVVLQLPLPKLYSSYDVNAAVNSISMMCDVDALTTGNRAMLQSGTAPSDPMQFFVKPCTALGVMAVLSDKGIGCKLDGAHVVLIGRSQLVGEPLYKMLLNMNATVTTCHSHTVNLRSITKTADILIVAAGVPGLIGKDDIKEGAVVIDVGINYVDGKMCGDVRTEEVADKASFVTPVPRGIGQMTTAMLVKQLFDMEANKYNEI